MERSRFEFNDPASPNQTRASVTFEGDLAITRLYYTRDTAGVTVREIEANPPAGYAGLLPVGANGFSLESTFGQKQFFSLRFDLEPTLTDLLLGSTREANGPLLLANPGGCVDCNFESQNRPTKFTIVEGDTNFEVPEPGTLMLVGGAFALAGLARRRRTEV